LLDAEGKLAVVYKGPVSVKQLLADVASLARNEGDVRNAAAPFPGQWYTDPFPPDLIAIPARMVGLGRGTDAYDYLSRYVTAGMQRGDETSVWQQLGVTAEKASKVYHNTALLLVQEGKPNEAAQAFRSALRYQPSAWETHVQLSGLLIRLGASAEAIAQTRDMLRLRPNHPIPLNNMAWVLATSTDSQIRDVPKAITLAERVCEATGHKEPTALDTLAVAYAAAGRFPDAIDTASKAVHEATALGRKDVAEQIRVRLHLYEAGKSYPPNASP
jgi:tetratricopeptide (TPR) repeat protein